MMLIPNRNIDQLKYFVCFIVGEFGFMIWIEFRDEMFKGKQSLKNDKNWMEINFSVEVMVWTCEIA